MSKLILEWSALANDITDRCLWNVKKNEEKKMNKSNDYCRWYENMKIIKYVYVFHNSVSLFALSSGKKYNRNSESTIYVLAFYASFFFLVHLYINLIIFSLGFDRSSGSFVFYESIKISVTNRKVISGKVSHFYICFFFLYLFNRFSYLIHDESDINSW